MRSGGAVGGQAGLVLGGGAAGVCCRGDELRRDVGGEAEGLRRHKRALLRSEEGHGLEARAGGRRGGVLVWMKELAMGDLERLSWPAWWVEHAKPQRRRVGVRSVIGTAAAA